jgi:CheY-like chemotaxis protein
VRPSGDSPPDRPVIFTVDDEPEALSRVEGELRRRFGADYRIVCSDSAEDALATLDALLAEGAEVAVVLADQWMPGTTGTDLLVRVGTLHPGAKRGHPFGGGPVAVVGERGSSRSSEVRGLLTRNGVPHAFHLPPREAAAAGAGDDAPSLIFAQPLEKRPLLDLCRRQGLRLLRAGGVRMSIASVSGSQTHGGPLWRR